MNEHASRKSDEMNCQDFHNRTVRAKSETEVCATACKPNWCVPRAIFRSNLELIRRIKIKKNSATPLHIRNSDKACSSPMLTFQEPASNATLQTPTSARVLSCGLFPSWRRSKKTGIKQPRASWTAGLCTVLTNRFATSRHKSKRCAQSAATVWQAFWSLRWI